MSDAEQQQYPNLVTYRIAEVRERIEAVTDRSDEITIVGVTKGQSIDAVRGALNNDIFDIGENYAQELFEKHHMLTPAEQQKIRWNFIGSIQSNKVAEIAHIVSLWQSVDRPKIVDTIAKHSVGARVLIQVNTTNEPSKGGVELEKTPTLVAHARAAGLQVEGLMTIGAAGEAEKTRLGFSGLAEMASDLKLSTLSMGMSTDMELAIEEGSNMVRLGRVLFGPRHHAQRQQG